MNEDVQEKIKEIQIHQQNLSNLSNQRQQFQMQLSEVESALSEIATSGNTYKIIGNVMVAIDKEKLKAELEEKKHMATIRISSIEKQENSIREKTESLQSDVMKKLERRKGKDDSKD